MKDREKANEQFGKKHEAPRKPPSRREKASGESGHSKEPPDGGGEYHRLLIEHALDLIALLDREGRVLYNAPSVETVLGYEPDELNGENIFELVHPDDVQHVIASFARNLGTPGAMEYVEYRFRHKDGSWRFLGSLGNNLLHDPALEGIVVNSRDITDHKRVESALRESENLYRALVQASPHAVTASDPEGYFTYISPQTLRLHGYESEDELLGRSAFDLIAPEDHEKASQNFSNIFVEGLTRNVDLKLLRKDGSRFTGEVNAALIRDPQGKPKSLVAFTRDITERRRMERDLHARNEELEAFAHTISHDLLTPAAVVEGYAKTVLETGTEGRPDAERECLESIVRGASRMRNLIDSLLQYAQAGHLDMEAGYAKPGEVLREIVEDLKNEIIDRGAELIIAPDMPAIAVDSIKLHQVFSNLVGNALKHMGDAPRPRIEIGASEENGNVIFHIRDNGVGIPFEFQKMVFEPFKHFSISGAPGLGIGLATVKRAVKTWGGKVWVESKPGGGATFYFTATAVAASPSSP